MRLQLLAMINQSLRVFRFYFSLQSDMTERNELQTESDFYRGFVWLWRQRSRSTPVWPVPVCGMRIFVVASTVYSQCAWHYACVVCVCVPYALSMNTPEVHTANHNKLQNAISFCIRCRARLFYAWTDHIFVVQFVSPRIVLHRIEWYREAAQIAAWLHCQSICRSRAEYEDMIRQISVSYSDKVRMHRRKL